MKKTLALLAALALSVPMAFSQGSINFANTGFSDGIDRLVYDGPVGGTSKLVGSSYVAALYYGTSAGSINSFAVRSLTVTADQTLDRSVVLFRAITPDNALAGTWTGGTRFFTDAAVGAALKLQIRVWDISKFATYAAAVAGGGKVGQSDIFDYTVPASTDAPGLKITNMRAFAVVPEPSTIALGVLGLGSLFLFRRRASK